MSRSYKKTPKYTDHTRNTTQEIKKYANRLVRKHNKKIVRGYLIDDIRFRDELTLDKKYYRKYYQSYNISDYSIYLTEEEARRYYKYRKDKFKNEKQYIDKYYKKYFYRK